MNTPVLAAVRPDALPAAAPRDVPLGATWFRVVRGGAFDGRPLRTGDLVVCGGRAGVDDAIVLVPGGRGAPRLGHVRRDGLHGDLGEPCDPARWTVAGRIVRVIPSRAAVEDRPVPRLAFRGVPVRAAQLALFSA